MTICSLPDFANFNYGFDLHEPPTYPYKMRKAGTVMENTVSLTISTAAVVEMIMSWRH
jgi:hypothetical protein